MKEYDWSNKCILVVDEDEANHFFISTALKKTGVKLLFIKKGRDSIDMVQSHAEIDMILMDIRLPELDDYEVIGQIRWINPTLPIVALTDYLMVSEKGAIMQSRCNEIILKPMSYKALMKVCVKYLDT